MDFVKVILGFDKHSRKQTSAVIKVRIKDINQLFNSMDPSPFQERDLDADAEEFIESWAFEYPTNANFSLEICVEQELPPEKNETFITEAIHNFYKHKAEIKWRELKQLLREGRVSLFVGIFFLGLCFAATEILSKFEHKTLADFLREGMLIAGWVSMWKPIEIHLYRWWPLLRVAKVYAKMSKMKIVIKRTQK